VSGGAIEVMIQEEQVRTMAVNGGYAIALQYAS
jgi:hypothetical protein